LLSGFENIYAINRNNILISGEKGIYHLNYEKYKNALKDISIRICKVRVFNERDSLLFGGFRNGKNSIEGASKMNDISIEHDWKNIHFEFSSPVYGNDNSVSYAYKLEGYDKDWSDWSSKSEKDYTNLPPGRYSFKVKAKNNLNTESAIESFEFTITPPFYRTIWAYGIYLIIFLSSPVVFYLYQKRKLKYQQQKHEEEQRKLQYVHQLELTKTEGELIALRNEKLQSDIEHKNTELATSAMHLVQKGELLSKLKSDLSGLMRKMDNEYAISEIKKMIKVLGEDEKMDEDWEHFSQHFDHVHSNFIKILKEVHPSLSPNEIKLCTYLRMNLSTKEIAQLMNISVRGVEIGRYRLRKKINLPTETNLVEYMISLSENDNQDFSRTKS
jgi:DNA-binding CsgD family transcriptional regulator